MLLLRSSLGQQALSQRFGPGPNLARPQRVVVRPAASGGFGKTTKKKTKKDTNLARELRELAAEKSGITQAGSKKSGSSAPPGFPVDWVDTKFNASGFTIGKATKPIILATGKSIMLYRLGDRVFCSDAASTAYQYPLVDAKVYESGMDVLVEVPLDGTIYNLQTGAVVDWCPKNTAVRNLLGSLKSSVQAQPLPVYPVHITEKGDIWIKLLQ